MNVAKQINLVNNSQGLALWQRNYYEHIIINDEELYKIRHTLNNPLKYNITERYKDNWQCKLSDFTPTPQ
jgi:hypothetical protein